jgi:hypothetical protein
MAEELTYYEVDPSRLGKPLTLGEFEQGYTHTLDLLDAAKRAGETALAGQLDRLADATAALYPALYHQHVEGVYSNL